MTFNKTHTFKQLILCRLTIAIP